MNNIKNKLIIDIVQDKFEIEYQLCLKLKELLLSMMKDYFKINENSCIVTIQKNKNSLSKFNFSCEIFDICKSNF